MSFGLVKHNNNSISAITTAGNLAQGKMTLIKEQTASSSASISFIHGSSDVVFDSTYPIYMFKYISVHPATNDQPFLFQGTTDGTNFNTTITSTNFQALGRESGSSPNLGYETSQDLANSTDFQYIQKDFGNDDDQNGAGNLFVFNPSSTTFVKHFIGEGSNSHDADISIHSFQAGYFNTQSAITGIQFKFASGNIDAGTIKLYGIKGS
tara:strand:- start:206 stop:832 length:627 start_codon:yes stop_codon:yes gene_type:complete